MYIKRKENIFKVEQQEILDEPTSLKPTKSQNIFKIERMNINTCTYASLDLLKINNPKKELFKVKKLEIFNNNLLYEAVTQIQAPKQSLPKENKIVNVKEVRRSKRNLSATKVKK
jgi:hypothetical protein